MRGRSVSASLFGVLLWWVASGAQASGPYIHRQLKFGFTPPAGWVLKSRSDTAVSFTEPLRNAPPSAPRSRAETNQEFLERIRRTLKQKPVVSSAVQASIAVSARPTPYADIPAYARDTRAKAAKAGWFKIVAETPRKLGGLPALERIMMVTLAGNPATQSREIACLRDGRLFVITLTAPPSNFKRYSNEFDRVLASFVWTQ